MGGVVGGVVGGLAGLALIIFLVWYARRRRRRQQGEVPGQAAALPPTAGQNVTVPVQEYKGAFGELPDTPVRPELSGPPSQMAHELPADTSR